MSFPLLHEPRHVADAALPVDHGEQEGIDACESACARNSGSAGTGRSARARSTAAARARAAGEDVLLLAAQKVMTDSIRACRLAGELRYGPWRSLACGRAEAYCRKPLDEFLETQRIGRRASANASEP